MRENVGFVGAGIMGKPMAMNLLKKGFKVSVLPHRNMAPIEGLRSAGASVARNLRELGAQSPVVILMLPGPTEIEQVIVGDGELLEAMKPDSTIIDMSTSDPDVTRRLAAIVESHGCHLLDAPVSRGHAGAIAGTLSIMVGGRRDVFERCRPVLEAMGTDIIYVGPNGTGHAVKLLHNLKTETEIALIAEILALAERVNVPLKPLLEVFGVSSANSYSLQTKAPKIVNRDFEPGFTLRFAHKDLRLGTMLAERAGQPLFLANVAKQLYQMAIDEGLGEKDVTAVYLILERPQKEEGSK